MAKRRGPGRPKGSGKKNKKNTKSHVLPEGFWRQVGAVFLIIIAIISFLGFFGIGGTFPVGLAGALLWVIGWAAYALPLLFIWQAIQIFLAEDNRISPITWVATVFFLWFLSGITQLLLDNPNILSVSTEPLSGQGGGFLGWLIDAQIFAGAFDTPIMALILVILCLVLLLFVLAITPSQVVNGIRRLFGSESDEEEEQNKAIAKRVGIIDGPIGVGKIVKKDSATTTKPINQDIAKKDDALISKSDPDWKFPSLNLLQKNAAKANPGDFVKNGQTIINTLAMFEISVVGDVEANVGPRVTQYAFLVKSGTKLKKITGLEDELKSALKARSLRIEAPISGKQEIGIEVPNEVPADVRLYGMLNEPDWQEQKGDLTFAVGRDTSNQPIFADLADMPHLLVAGQTKSGKSVMVNSILTSFLYSKKPSELKMILIDPKRAEMGRYKDIPHLLTPVILGSEQEEIDKVIKALVWTAAEMERRNKVIADASVTNIQEYNEQIDKIEADPDNENETSGKMPYIVVVVDEMADFMMAAGKEAEKLIIRLAQKGRSAGVHLILATQSPRKEVVTGLVKANVPATIAFSVRNYTESVIVLGSNGAEKLLGRGDMLFSTADSPSPKRIQGTLIDNSEVNEVVSFVKLKNNLVEYNDDILATPVQSMGGRGGIVMGGGEVKRDVLFNDVAQFAIDNGSLTTNSIAVNFDVGNPRAARIMIQLEKAGIVGQKNGTKPREVLVSSLDESE